MGGEGARFPTLRSTDRSAGRGRRLQLLLPPPTPRTAASLGAAAGEAGAGLGRTALPSTGAAGPASPGPRRGRPPPRRAAGREAGAAGRARLGPGLPPGAPLGPDRAGLRLQRFQFGLLRMNHPLSRRLASFPPPPPEAPWPASRTVQRRPGASGRPGSGRRLSPSRCWPGPGAGSGLEGQEPRAACGMASTGGKKGGPRPGAPGPQEGRVGPRGPVGRPHSPDLVSNPPRGPGEEAGHPPAPHPHPKLRAGRPSRPRKRNSSPGPAPRAAVRVRSAVLTEATGPRGPATPPGLQARPRGATPGARRGSPGPAGAGAGGPLSPSDPRPAHPTREGPLRARGGIGGPGNGAPQGPGPGSGAGRAGSSEAGTRTREGPGREVRGLRIPLRLRPHSGPPAPGPNGKLGKVGDEPRDPGSAHRAPPHRGGSGPVRVRVRAPGRGTAASPRMWAPPRPAPRRPRPRSPRDRQPRRGDPAQVRVQVSPGARARRWEPAARSPPVPAPGEDAWGAPGGCLEEAASPPRRAVLTREMGAVSAPRPPRGAARMPPRRSRRGAVTGCPGRPNSLRCVPSGVGVLVPEPRGHRGRGAPRTGLEAARSRPRPPGGRGGSAGWAGGPVSMMRGAGRGGPPGRNFRPGID